MTLTLLRELREGGAVNKHKHAPRAYAYMPAARSQDVRQLFVWELLLCKEICMVGAPTVRVARSLHVGHIIVALAAQMEQMGQWSWPSR